MKKLRWRRQKQQKNKGGQQLHHRFMFGNLFERTLGYRLEQPATNHKKTRQSKEYKHRIIAHPRITQTEMAHMRKHYENHRKSSHRINVFNPLFSHFAHKSTEKSWNSCEFQQKIVLLHL